MPAFQDILKTIRHILAKPFSIVVSISSFVGLFYLILADPQSTIIALSVFCVMVVAFTGYLIWLLYKSFENLNNPFHVNSQFVKYETSDANRVIFECFKVAQAQQPLLTEYPWQFKWTGTQMPVISSDCQVVGTLTQDGDRTNYDKVVLKFPQPLHLNQTTVIHFKAVMNDADSSSEPKVEAKIIHECDFIQFRIVLRYKDPDKTAPAILERKKIDTQTGSGFDQITMVPFDKDTKSYEHQLFSPEVGYIYKIRWDR